MGRTNTLFENETKFKLIDILWPWGKIKRLKIALNQSLQDNQTLADKLSELTDRDERGRFVKKPK